MYTPAKFTGSVFIFEDVSRRFFFWEERDVVEEARRRSIVRLAGESSALDSRFLFRCFMSGLMSSRSSSESVSMSCATGKTATSVGDMIRLARRTSTER